MSNALAKIWARRIYARTHTIEEVDERYGVEGHKAVVSAYYKLYGIDLDAED